jgi:TonB family protein
MELKKSKKSSLENKRAIFFQIAFTIVLSLVFVAFEWESSSSDIIILADGRDITLEDEIIPFFRIEKQPEFPGGEGALMQFLAENTKYPADAAIDLNISGTVYVYFVINKQGKIVDTRIERGFYKSLDNEAVRVIKSMPNWNPGKQRSKPISVSKVIPISFVLAN